MEIFSTPRHPLSDKRTKMYIISGKKEKWTLRQEWTNKTTENTASNCHPILSLLSIYVSLSFSHHISLSLSLSPFLQYTVNFCGVSVTQVPIFQPNAELFFCLIFHTNLSLSVFIFCILLGSRDSTYRSGLQMADRVSHNEIIEEMKSLPIFQTTYKLY